MMKRITHIDAHNDYSISLTFNDGIEKDIDFKQFIGSDPISAPLGEIAYFLQVQIYPNGRGIFWPNEFDFCPDYLHDLQIKQPYFFPTPKSIR